MRWEWEGKLNSISIYISAHGIELRNLRISFPCRGLDLNFTARRTGTIQVQRLANLAIRAIEGGPFVNILLSDSASPPPPPLLKRGAADHTGLRSFFLKKNPPNPC